MIQETKEYAERTELQNRALHLYFQLVADTLNDAGLDMRAVLKPGIDIPWSKDTVKNFLWRPIQRVLLGKESTTELETVEIDKVFDVMNRHLANHGVHEDFPSIETIKLKLEEERQLRKNKNGILRP